MSPAFDAHTSRQTSAGLDARRVESTRPRPASRRPLEAVASPTTSINALTVNCGRWLKNGHQSIVLFRIHRRRPCAEALPRIRPIDRRPAPGSFRLASESTAAPGTGPPARTQSLPVRRRRLGDLRRTLPATPDSAHAALTMSRLVPPTSVIRPPSPMIAAASGRSRTFCSTGAARMTRSLPPRSATLLHGPIDRAAPRSMREHCRTIDRGDADRRPAFADRERDRTADQAESDDGDLLKRWLFAG